MLPVADLMSARPLSVVRILPLVVPMLMAAAVVVPILSVVAVVVSSAPATRTVLLVVLTVSALVPAAFWTWKAVVEFVLVWTLEPAADLLISLPLASSGHEMGIKQQGRGMGLQAAAIASQINLNNSQAEKNRAEETIKSMVKPTIKQWIEIIKLVSTFIIGVLTTLTIIS